MFTNSAINEEKAHACSVWETEESHSEETTFELAGRMKAEGALQTCQRPETGRIVWEDEKAG